MSSWRSTLTNPLPYQEMCVSRGAARSTGTGRFLSVDPEVDIDKAVHVPQKWNRYSYALNNPIRYFDPNGKAETDLRCDVCTTPEMQAAFRQGQTQGMKWGLAIDAAIIGGIEAPALARAAFTALPRTFMWLSELGAGAAGVSANLQRLSNAGGPTVRLVSNLTQSPQEGRALSAAAGEGAEALANAARSGEGVKTFVGNVPKALLQGLEHAGLLQVRTTQMNGVQATEYRFLKGASQYIVKYFNEQKPQ